MNRRPPHLLPGQSDARQAQLLSETPLEAWRQEVAQGGIFSAEKLAALAVVMGLFFSQLGLIATPAAQAATSVFQEGSGGYAATLDTEIDEAMPDLPAGDKSEATEIRVDWMTGNYQQGLIKFGSIFDNDGGPIPIGSTINSAILEVNVFNDADFATVVTINRMLGAWPETATWSSTGSGVQLDDIEASATEDDSLTGTETDTVGWKSLDVTASVTAWSGGAANHGWVITSDDDNNGLHFYTSEYGTASLRPKLTVDYTAPISNTITVNSTGDASDNNPGDDVCDTGGTVGADPECTLRAAIQEANASATVDTIHFNIPGAGPHTIAVASALPALTTTVTIDGTTQEAFSGDNNPAVALVTTGPEVIVDYGESVAGDGLDADAPNVSLFGIGVNGAGGHGILVTGDNVTLDAVTLTRNGENGVYFLGTTGSQVTNSVTRDNGVTNSVGDGFTLWNAINITISSNEIVDNAAFGIDAASGALTGITIDSNVITGNGFVNGSQQSGIGVRTGASMMVSNNTISGNNGDGVTVIDGVTGVTLSRNSISGNGNVGIDLTNTTSLSGDGITANDVGDSDTGGNELLNFPVITSASESGGTVTVGFDLDVPNGSYRIEFFTNPSGADPSGNGEGETYAGFVDVTVTGGVPSPASTTLSGSAGDVLTAATTEGIALPFGSTSEFSAAFTVTSADVVTVNSTGDASDNNPGDDVCDTGGTVGSDPECTLRAAIQEANASATVDTIHFDIPAALTGGTHLIAPGSNLPDITAAVTVDASTEPDFAGTPIVTLSGENAFFDTGLVLEAGADGSEIRGFVIRDWGVDGIEVAPSNDGSTIAGNYIGRLTVAGVDSGAGTNNNNAGIWGRGSNTTIGGTTAADRNVISGNGTHGIVFSGAASSNDVVGNYIGVAADGSTPLGNAVQGVRLDSGANSNTIGGSTAQHGNVISGNGSGDAGILVLDATTSGNVIRFNKVGTNAAGTAAVPNNLHGIRIDNAPNTQLLDNLVSGNDVHGIYVYDIGSTGTQILRNTIGTNAAQTAAVPNLFDGIRLEGGSTNTTIGTAGNGNVISGNAQEGITINDNTGTTIQGNYIGTDSTGTEVLGNGGYGVFNEVFGSSDNLIGGDGPGEGNVIAHNAIGVLLNGGNNNAIVGNDIYSNTNLGIDIGDDGVTPNGVGDPLDFPVITSATESAGTVTVDFTLTTVPDGSYRIEFFDNNAADPSGNGEGETWVGSVDVTVTSGVPSPSSTTFPGAAGDIITATATEGTSAPFGQTSEFSAAYTVAASNGAPTAVPGGPYSTDEGEDLILDGSGSTDPDSDPLTYNWDIDNDGQYDDATGVNPTVPWLTLVGLGFNDDGGPHPVGLEVDDGNGNTDTATVNWTIANTPPTVSVGGLGTAAAGVLYTATLSVTDPGNDTVTQWTINWGDGNIDTIGGNPGSFDHTYAVAGEYNIIASVVDEDGTWTNADLIVPSLQAGSTHIGRYDGSTGVAVADLGPGSPLDRAHAAVVGPDGLLYVSSYWNGLILRFDLATNTYFDTFVDAADPLVGPAGLTFGPDGNLYVSDYDAGAVRRYRAGDGVNLGIFASGGGINGPADLTFGTDGHLYVAGWWSDDVHRYRGDTGAHMVEFVTTGSGLLDQPDGIAFGPDGKLYVSSLATDEVKRYNSDGSYDLDFVTFQSDGLDGPTGLRFGPDGHLYVGSEITDSVKRYHGTTGAPLPGNDFVTTNSGGLDRPAYLTFLADDHVTVSQAPNGSPTAVPGGPYATDEGEDLVLDGSGSTDPDTDPLAYNWDIDNDGQYDDATGPNPTIPWLTLVGLGFDDDGGPYPIGLEVDDGNGNTDTATVNWTIDNTPPTISITGGGSVGRGLVYTANLSVSDPGGDTVTEWTINWGDGTIDTIAGNPATATHAYANPGSYNITAAVLDEDSLPNRPWHNDRMIVPGLFANEQLFRLEATTGTVVDNLATGSGQGWAITAIIGPDGLAYVGDYTGDSIRRYNPVTGADLGVWIPANTGGLDGPAGMQFGPDGHLYVSSNFGDEILQFAADGTFVGVFASGGGLDEPDDLTFGPDGHLYVTSFNTDEVLKYNGRDGNPMGAFASGPEIDQPSELVFGPGGKLYVTSVANDQVVRYNADGSLDVVFATAGATGLNEPRGATFGPDGHLYVGGRNRIVRYDGSSGALIDVYLPSGSISGPSQSALIPAHQVSVLPFIVNSTGDAADNNPGDGVCYTGGANSETNPECTLRAAIEEANAFAGTDTINFNMPATETGHSAGVWTLNPGSDFDQLIGTVVIDGRSQPGWTSTPVVEINGSGAVSDGFRIAADDVEIHGLAINRFPGDGIDAATGAANAVIAASHIGVDATGLIDRGNIGRGIYLAPGSGPTRVGGGEIAHRNVISGNGSNGMVISGSDGNVILNNFIGTDVTGSVALSNGADGIYVGGTSGGNVIGQVGDINIISGNADDGVEIDATGANNIIYYNLIGIGADGTSVVANGRHGVVIYDGGNNTWVYQNLIAGNTATGVVIDGNGNAATANNNVIGNYIGLDLASNPRPNGTHGVHIFGGATLNAVGGLPVEYQNIISGNGVDGIRIEGAATSGNRVENNYIGTNIAGDAPVANGNNGVFIVGAPSNTVGGATPNHRNVISGNGNNGVLLDAAAATGNTIAGNYVGLNAAGDAAVPNADEGVDLSDAPNNTVGGTSAGERNVIAGNGQDGVLLIGSLATGNNVSGNYIGTNAAGDTAIANGRAGVYIDNAASGNTVGGATASHGNVISGNTEDGIYLTDSGTDLNRITHNYIGTNAAGDAAVPNGDRGVQVESGASFTWIGDVGQGNVISGNTGDGIIIADWLSLGTSDNYIIENLIGVAADGTTPLGNGANGVHIDPVADTLIGTNTIAHNAWDGVLLEPTSLTGNSIVGNSIHSNGQLGIDLGNDGVTPNDPGDGDPGPNDLLNHPEITSAVAGGGNITVDFNLDVPAGDYRIEFFANSTADPSGNGEGETYVDSYDVLAHPGGSAGYSTSIPGAAYDVITATATEQVAAPYGSSSEFSAAFVAATGVMTVNSTGDGGDTAVGDGLCDTGGLNSAGDPECTLRAAIEEANFDGGADDIEFDIPVSDVNHSAGIWTIAPGSQFQNLSTTMSINGATQPGWAGDPIIQIDGSADLTSSAGLNVFSSNTEIRGLILHSFPDEGIESDGSLGGGDGNTFAGNWVGIDASGAAAPNGGFGILLTDGAANNTVGGPNPEDANAVGGNAVGGIGVWLLGTDNNRVYGNYVGVLNDGVTPVPNSGNGVDIDGQAAGNEIGGTSAQANTIRSNTGDGVYLSASAGSGNSILRNVIAANTGLGINLDDPADPASGVTPNDAGDGDGGPNGLLNYPVIDSAVIAPPWITVNYTVDVPAGDYVVEFFSNPSGADPSGNGEGQAFEYRDSISHPGGSQSYVAVFSGFITDELTATLTEDLSGSFGSTSEFSGVAPVTAGALVVNSTGNGNDAAPGNGACDTGGTIVGGDPECTLNAAIQEANALGGTSDIHFAIPDSDTGYQNLGAGSSYWKIRPAASIATLTADDITIDATTQTTYAVGQGFFVNDLGPEVELDGSLVSGIGLEIQSSSNEIRGFVINRFATGIKLTGGGSSNTVAGNYIGTGVDGVTGSVGNTTEGILIEQSTTNIIGGTAGADRNIVSGNRQRGITVDDWTDGAAIVSDGTEIINNYVGVDRTGTTTVSFDGTNDQQIGIYLLDTADTTVGTPATGNVISGNSWFGVYSWGVDSSGIVIQNNIVGLDRAATNPIPNGYESAFRAGIYASNTPGILIGGTGPSEGNVIASNGYFGILLTGASAIDNAILGNSIFGNGDIGIGLELDGVTPNDPGDGDTGANHVLNFPEITSATESAGTVTVGFDLDVPAGAYRIEFFVNPSGADPSGNGEGETFVDFYNVVGHPGGAASYSTSFPGSAGDILTATTTEGTAAPFGSTSEFSAAVAATLDDVIPPVITLVGANPQTIEVGSPYVELGATAWDNVDGDITGSIVIDATAVNTAVLGSYPVTYNVSDAAGNPAIEVIRTVDVVDTTAPVITLVGANPQVIEVGSLYVELGATATDNYDGDLTGSIVIDATAVNTTLVGSYSVTYDVTDSNGNAAIQVTRTVNVVDTTAPVITLVGANPQTIEVGSLYVELGATATDNYDGDLTGSIVIDATGVDTSTVGSYSVTYDVTDSQGNPAVQVVRTVDVVDTTAPVITLVGANPQTIEVGSPYVELGATAWDLGDGDLTGSIVIDASAVNTGVVGSYPVTYDVTDSQGNLATQVVRTVDVVDTTLPVITLLGANPQMIEVGSPYVELGATATDNYDGDITGSIVIDATGVDTSTMGSYSVTYDVTDSNGNAAIQVTRTVDVVDTTAPVITLVGANPQVIEVGSPYAELGATATDNYDGDLTGSIVIDASAVNTGVVGSYSVTYDVTDSHGNPAVQVVRTVDVVDTTAPVITLVGANPQTIEVGSPYVELGATATDNYDGDLTGSIVIDATAVNTAVVGSYPVTYNVTDSQGNPAVQVLRTVDVVDTTAPIITLLGSNPQQIEVGSPYVELGATATDNYDGDLTGSIVIDASAVNTGVVGSYPVTYDVTDSQGNPAVQVVRTVDVVDTTAPIITLLGANPQTIEVGSPYVELGATAFDNYDGDLTGSIVIDASAVNTAVVGSYPVTYDVTDSHGNPATQAVRTVDAVDTTAPVITLVGANPQVIEVGSPYVELGATATDNYEGDLTGSIVIDATAVNTAIVGSYPVTYNVTDSNGNPAVPAIRTVNVVDTQAPVLTLLGPNPQTIEVGSPYVELGATAFDNYDGDITGSIVIDASAVNTAVVGSYVVSYTVADSSGNPALGFRTVDVVDTTAPVIALVGANPQTIEVGSPYVELGATATDNYDGDITGSIVIDASAVNTAIVGSYPVTYDVTDSNGNSATQVVRTVDVVDTTAPVITLLGANPQTIDVMSPYVELGATAFDNYDGDITGSIVIDASAVNTSVVGSYPVTYNVTDSQGNPAVQVVRTVNIINVAPTLGALFNQAVDEMTPVTFTATASDPDPTDALTFSLAGAPGGASIDPVSGVFSWTPTEAQGPNSHTFDVVVTDSGSPPLSDSQTITITVAEVNLQPTLNPIPPQTVDELTVMSFVATAGDPDVPANGLTFILTGAPAGAAIDPVTGVFTWIPAEDQGPGVYSFDIQVSDTGSPPLSDTQPVTVTVNEVNVAPVVADPGPLTNAEGDTVSLPISASDADIPANTLTYSATGLPTGLSIDPVGGLISGVIDFTANAASPFSTTITATDDGSPNRSGQVTFVWTVSDTNRPPVAVDDTVATSEDTPVTINVVANDSDPDGDPVAVSGFSSPAHGTVALVGPSLVYTPDLNYNGLDSFGCTVSDGRGGSVGATVTVSIAPVNDPPSLNALTQLNVNEGSLATFVTSASDVEGDTVTFSLQGAPAGAAIDPDDGTFAWVPAEDQGPGSYTFAIVGTDAGSPPAIGSHTVRINVAEVNNAPIVTNPGTLVHAENQVVSVTVTATDPDIPAGNLTYSATGLPPGLSIDPDTGEISGVPPFNAAAGSPYTATVTATDDGAPSRTGSTTFSWVITNTNRPPAAFDLTVFAEAGVPVSLVLNGTDPDGDVLSFAVVDPPEQGALTGGPRLYDFTAGIGADGIDTFTFVVSDGVAQATGTVTIFITPNLPPVGGPDEYNVRKRGVLVIDPPGVLSNDSDPEGRPISAIVDTQPAHGKLTLAPDGSFVYEHSDALSESDVFAYRVDDGMQLSGPVSVIINVEDNLAPVAVADTITTDEDTAVTIRALDNDYDPNNEAIIVTDVVEWQQGTVSWSIDGAFRYTPPRDWHGTGVIMYEISDGDLVADGIISVEVLPVNDPPQATGAELTGDSGDVMLVDLSPFATDADGDPLDFLLESPPTTSVRKVGAATFELDLDGVITDLPPLTFVVADPSGAKDTAALLLRVRIPAELVGIPSLVADDIGGSGGPGRGAAGDAPSAGGPMVTGLRLMVGSVLDTFRAFRFPMIGLLLVLVASLWMGLSRRFAFSSTPTLLPVGNKRKVDIIMAPSSAGVPVRNEPGSHQAVVHRFGADERGIVATGARSMLRSEVWVEVETPEGDGWVNSEFLTEQQPAAAFHSDERPTRLVRVFVEAIYRSDDLLPMTGGHDLHVALFGPPVRFASGALPRLLSGASVYWWWGPEGDTPRHQGTFAETVGESFTQAFRNRDAHSFEPAFSIPLEFRNMHSLVVGNDEHGEGWRVFFRFEDGEPLVGGLMREAAPNPAAMHGRSELQHS